MQTTMTLLDRALATGKTIPEWTRELGLSRNVLYTAQIRGHLSPAIAGALASALDEDFEHWMAVAGLETEKDSACKQLMLKQFRKMERAMGIEPTS